jgi:hypothetical protein
LVNQVALHIFSLLEKDNSKPITLGWHDEEAQVNTTLTAEPPQIHKNCQLKTEKITKRNRKLPKTRTDDYLWNI